MRIIAIVRKDEKTFLMYDPVAKQPIDFFEVPEGDSYLKLPMDSIMFSDFDEVTTSSEEILSMTPQPPPGSPPFVFAMLEFDDVASIIDTAFAHAKDQIQALSKSQIKH